MRLPSFCYMGGKSRLRNWLVSHFPKSGRCYIEPFVGRGNVFFASKSSLDFREWKIGDINTNFFDSLMRIDLESLPDSVSREEFEAYKNSTSDVSIVIEPRITYAGKGYRFGFEACHPTHTLYQGSLYRKNCELARSLLSEASIEQKNWFEWDWDCLTHDDFVYLDPPYLGTKASYPNINHENLVETLNTAKFRWAVSGYPSDLYDSKLRFANRFEKDRESGIKGLNAGRRVSAKETLWTNYDA